MRAQQAHWLAQREAALSAQSELRPASEKVIATDAKHQRSITAELDSTSPAAAVCRQIPGRTAITARQLVEQAVREELNTMREPQLGSTAARPRSPQGAHESRSKMMHRVPDGTDDSVAATRRMLEQIAADEEALGLWCLQGEMQLPLKSEDEQPPTITAIVTGKQASQASRATPHLCGAPHEDEEDFAELDEIEGFLAAMEFQMHEIDDL